MRDSHAFVIETEKNHVAGRFVLEDRLLTPAQRDLFGTAEIFNRIGNSVQHTLCAQFLISAQLKKENPAAIFTLIFAVMSIGRAGGD